jgi:nitrogen fixation-related uncharacterized protein
MILWLTFILIVSIPAGTIIFWAITDNQFNNQDKARYLALNASIKDKEKNDKA